MNKPNVLFFSRTMGLGGTEKVILQLCDVLKETTNNIVVCSCGGINVEKLISMGIKHYEIPDIEKKNLSSIIKVLVKVFWIINVEHIAIVHTHHRMAAFYARILLLVKKFIFINTSHNVFHNKRRLTKFALEKANIIAVGKKVKENLCDVYGIPDSQITVIYNAVDSFRDEVVEIEVLKKHKENKDFLVGNIGRLTEQKGMEYFIEAIPNVLAQCPNTKFFIIGEGEDREKLENKISHLALEDKVLMLGYRIDIQNTMSQLDLIVLSSLWEGLPLTPIEAFSVKKTIVATNVDGTVEIVQNERNGLIVEPRDSSALANAIIRLNKDVEMRKDLEENAFLTYNEKFSYKGLSEKNISFYQKLYSV